MKENIVSKMISLEQVDSLSIDAFRRDYLSTHKPVVIKGGVNHWPAVSRWDSEYLKKNSTGAFVNVKSKADYTGGGFTTGK